MNGGAARIEAMPKLNLAELVAPVADDLLLLNENLQKVGTPTSVCLVCGGMQIMMQFFTSNSLWLAHTLSWLLMLFKRLMPVADCGC